MEEGPVIKSNETYERATSQEWFEAGKIRDFRLVNPPCQMPVRRDEVVATKRAQQPNCHQKQWRLQIDKSPDKILVGEMKQRPQNKYNGQTKQSTLTTKTTEEDLVLESNAIDEETTNQ